MIHIHPNENTIFIYVQRTVNCTLYNAIDFKNGNDVLYFVMAAAKFTGIDPNGDTLYISGWLETNSTLYTQLDGYFQNDSPRTRRLIPITSIGNYFILNRIIILSILSISYADYRR